jgi:HEAT repeat protein
VLFRETTDPRAKKILTTALQDEDIHIRIFTEFLLGEIEDLKVVELLLIPLQDENPYMRGYVVEDLQKITGQSFGEDYEAWFKWWQEHEK